MPANAPYPSPNDVESLAKVPYRQHTDSYIVICVLWAPSEPLVPPVGVSQGHSSAQCRQSGYRRRTRSPQCRQSGYRRSLRHVADPAKVFNATALLRGAPRYTGIVLDLPDAATPNCGSHCACDSSNSSTMRWIAAGEADAAVSGSTSVAW